MNITIDISSIPFGTGVSRYTANLVKSISKQVDESTKLHCYGFSLRQNQNLQHFLKENCLPGKTCALPPKALSLIFHKFGLPIDLFIGKSDIFHTWDWYLPKQKTGHTVITIHDLAMFKYPDIAHPEIKTHHSEVLQRILKFKTEIIAVSHATKTDLINLFNVNPDNITVIHEALPEELKITVNPAIVTQLKQKYHLHKPIILMVGTHEPRKNYKAQIEAWRKYKKDIDLVLVGKSGWEQIDPETGLIQVGYATPIELAAFYQMANCLMYCSLDEGFGLPILESIYHDTPVITSNCSSMKEIVDQEPGIELVDPQDINQMQQAIETVVYDANYRHLLNKENILKKFSWEKAAAQTLKLYKSLC